MEKQKELLSLMAAKFVLIAIIFMSLATIIITGGYIIAYYNKTSNDKIISYDQDVVLTTDKTEYEQGEEVKITIKNSLDKEIELIIGLQNYRNDERDDVSPDIFCFYSGRECKSIKILSKSKKELNWDQRVPWSNKKLKGSYRFKIVVWNNDDNTTAMMDFPDIYYSNEFTIKDSVVGPPPDYVFCSQDSDCKVNFSHCDCQYHCVNRNIEITNCAVECDETGPIISECICKNNKCVEAKFGKIDNKIIENKNLTNNDWNWDSGQNCHGLTSPEQCGFLNWPIRYGCRIADINNCYECLAEKNKDVSICENIEVKNNCYWRLVISLNKAGMNDKINFCDKFTGKYGQSYKKECLKMAK